MAWEGREVMACESLVLETSGIGYKVKYVFFLYLTSLKKITACFLLLGIEFSFIKRIKTFQLAKNLRM